MNEEIKKKLGELFELCMEMSEDKFVVGFDYSNYLDKVEVSVRVNHDPYPDLFSAYTDECPDKTLIDIYQLRFDLTEMHHEFKYGSAA